MVNSSSAKFPNNITYLGRCYDILELDPLNSAKTAKNRSAFEFKLDSAKPIVGESDNKLQPLGTNFSPGDGGSITGKTQMLFTTSDVQGMFKSKFNSGLLGILTGIIPFGLSASYQKFKREIISQKHIYAFTEAEFIDFTLELQLESPENLFIDKQFQEAVANLPIDESSTAYQTFIDNFGTHFAQLVKFGGIAYQSINLDGSNYSKFLQKGIDLKTQAQGIFNLNLGQESTETLQTEIIARKEQMQFNGGTPNTNLNEWFKSIRKDPAPVEMNLIPLHKLFTSVFFPLDADIAQKQRLMEQTVNFYLEQKTEKEEWQVWESPIFGGNGGSLFSDINFLTQHTQVKTVKVRMGDLLDAISITLDSGEELKHGGDGGNENSLTLREGEYITSVIVTSIDISFLQPPVGLSGSFLSSIEIRTNQDRSLLVGKPGGAFRIPIEVPKNYQIAGFHGFSGELIDKLGVLAIPRL